MNPVSALLAAAALVAPAMAATPKCAADAIDRAGKLLRFFYESDGSKLAAKPGEPDPKEGGEFQNWDVDKNAKALKPLSVNGGQYDVLEVNAYIYKATYRIHVLYLQGVDDCIPTGEEILAQ